MVTGTKFIVQLMIAGGILTGEAQFRMAMLPCTAAVVEGVNWKVVPIPRRHRESDFKKDGRRRYNGRPRIESSILMGH